jgi:hypothetical protein
MATAQTITLVRFASNDVDVIDTVTRQMHVEDGDVAPLTLEYDGHVYRRGVDGTRYVSVQNRHGRLKRSNGKLIIVD